MPPTRQGPRDIIDFVQGDQFLGDKNYSVAQLAILKAVYGLRMTSEEHAAFLAMHEGKPPKRGGYDELSLGAGRRGGKEEKIGAPILTYECVMFDPRHLAPGETAYGVLIAQNEKQARICRDYIEAKLKILESKGWPVFEKTEAQMRPITAEVIRLSNRVNIACFPCKKVSIRGITTIAVDLTEIGHWQLEPNAYNADVEIVRAVRPTRMTLRSKGYKVPLLKTSTPFDEVGVFYKDWSNRERSKQLVLHEVPTKYMNPSISDEELAKEQFEDADAYDREYLAKWGTGGEHKPFPREIVDACTDAGRKILPPQPNREYVAWIDAAFKRDLFAFGIGHRETERVVVDLLRYWTPRKGRPLSDKGIVAEIAPDLRLYGLDKVKGDQFCDVPLRSEFDTHGIRFIERPVTETSRYLEYNNLAAAMRAGLLRMPDDEEIKRDFTGLRKKGKWIGAPQLAGRHDDISTVIRGIVFDLMPMNAGTDLARLNEGAMADRDRLFKERGFPLPEREERFPTDIMAQVY